MGANDGEPASCRDRVSYDNVAQTVTTFAAATMKTTNEATNIYGNGGDDGITGGSANETISCGANALVTTPLMPVVAAPMTSRWSG